MILLRLYNLCESRNLYKRIKKKNHVSSIDNLVMVFACHVTGLCDFQYLPLVNSEDGQQQACVYDQLVPQGMEGADWLNHAAPLFLPPAAFTRMDTPQVRMWSVFIVSIISVKTHLLHLCQVQ